MRRSWFVFLILVLTFLVGCSPSIVPIQDDDNDQTKSETDADVMPEDEASPTSGREAEEAIVTNTPDRSERLKDSTLPPGLEKVQPTADNPVLGEVPDEIMQEIYADLAERSQVSIESIQVTRAESVVWKDGSLGCPQPGEFYTQALVNGYWVVLEAGGEVYDYRVNHKGYFMLCEGRGLAPPLVKTPDK